jgi:hypothetical protein
MHVTESCDCAFVNQSEASKARDTNRSPHRIGSRDYGQGGRGLKEAKASISVVSYGRVAYGLRHK